MKYRAATFLFALLAISALSPKAGFAQGDMSTQGPKKLSMMPYLRSTNCKPVEVKAVSNGATPPEVISALVAIQSYSDKPVKAVKIRWDIYRWGVGYRKRTTPCDAPPDSAKIYLSGTTPLIEVGRLVKGEVYDISSDPQMKSPLHATKTISVERPIIAFDELKSLTTDGTRDTFKDDYIGVVYVAEIVFEDGTKWEVEQK